jgi:hypothetical protein
MTVAHRWLCGQAVSNEVPHRRCLLGLGDRKAIEVRDPANRHMTGTGERSKGVHVRRLRLDACAFARRRELRASLGRSALPRAPRCASGYHRRLAFASSRPAAIAVLDVGKTNVKLLAIPPDGSIHYTGRLTPRHARG